MSSQHDHPGPPSGGMSVDRGATILVIDDEESLRRVLARLLAAEGYAVLEAADGEAGLRYVQEDAGAIALVLTDLVMPGINGSQVCETLARHRPDLPVICMSGYTPQQLDGHGCTPGRDLPFIPKPFKPGEIAAKIEQVLAGSRALRARGRNVAPTPPVSGVEPVDLVAVARSLQIAPLRR